jgi:hypothetical protein
MNKVKRFNDYYYEEMAFEFFKSMNELVMEDSNWKKIKDKIISDLNLNMKFVGTFGTGISAFYPIVDAIMKNTNIPVEKNPEIIVMMTITAFAIIYLEEKKFKNNKEEEIITKESKSLLEELKLRGVGNGIIKKLIKCFKSIKNIFNIISKRTGAVVNGFIDMFAYTSLLIPIMNGILFLINKYEFDLDTIIQNFISLSVGIGTIVCRHGIIELIKRIKDKVLLKDTDLKDIVDEIDISKINKFSDMPDLDDKQSGEMITEQ